MIKQVADKYLAAELAERTAITIFKESGKEQIIYMVCCGEGSWTEEQNHWYIADDTGIDQLEKRYEYADVYDKFGKEGWTE